MPQYRVKVNDAWYDVEVGDVSGSTVKVQVNGEEYEVEVERQSHRPATIAARPAASAPSTPPPPPRPTAPSAPAQPMPSQVPGTGAVKAPMPGTIIQVLVSVGDSVSRGQDVCVLEAMKMQQYLKSTQDGVVKAVHVEAGQKVGAQAVLLEIEPAG